MNRLGKGIGKIRKIWWVVYKNADLDQVLALKDSKSLIARSWEVWTESSCGLFSTLVHKLSP